MGMVANELEEPWPKRLHTPVSSSGPGDDGLVVGPLGVCAHTFSSSGGSRTSSCPQSRPSWVVLKHDSIIFRSVQRCPAHSAQSPRGPSQVVRTTTHAVLGEPKPALK